MGTVKPIKNSDKTKKQQVEEMFDSISGNYDFLNHFLSLGIDKRWRRKCVQTIAGIRPKHILDMATGTADLALECLSVNPEKVVGVDLSEGMLEMGRKKITQRKEDSRIQLLKGDSENLQFEDNSFDAATVGFGVRNFENLEKGLSEMNRVLRKGGKIAVLEFSKPRVFPVKQMYWFYFNAILPFWGRLFSKSNSAYTYLPESVKHFPDGKDFLTVLEKVGFKEVKEIRLSFGICSIYIGTK